MIDRNLAIVVSLVVAFIIAPLAADAQQARKVPRIGYLAPVYSCSGSVPTLEAFRQGLRERGYVDGNNIAIECRSAAGNSDRLPALAAELVHLQVDIIIAAGGEPVARAAKQATQTIPIVMTNVGDPVVTGIVASLARPHSIMRNATEIMSRAPHKTGGLR